jgi:radical SAM protein with 4Fe4S-binding SPASM domain
MDPFLFKILYHKKTGLIMFSDNFKNTANIEITTVIGCPVMCSFCPQVSLIKNFKLQNSLNLKDKVLTFDRYKEILDKLPVWVDVHFSGMSEPYASKDCTKMMEYTISKGHKICVYSTLVGANKEDLKFLSNVRFDKKYKLVIHLPDDEKNFKAKVDEKYIDNLKYFLNLPQIQKGIMLGHIDFMSMSRRGLTDPKIRALIPKRLNSFIAISRAGNLSNEKEMYEGKKIIKEKKGKIYCSAAPNLNHNVLLPNGDVVLCCMDYSIDHKIGNLLEQSYEDLFESEKLKEIFKSLTDDTGNKKLLCRTCEYAREGR